MPVLPLRARGVLQAMSDFWTIFVRDQALLTAYSEGIVLNVAQLYQTFLETVLGQHLAEAPIHSRIFYAPYTLREDTLFFVEGGVVGEAHYGIPVDTQLHDAEYLTNRVLLPTRVLLLGREFRLAKGTLFFDQNPFDSDLLAGFPTRVVESVTPVNWHSPLGVLSGDIQPGDIFQWSSSNSFARAQIQGRTGSVYHLNQAPKFFSQSFTKRTHQLDVLRVPFDTQQVGVSLSTHPSSVSRLTSDAADGVVDSVSTKIDLTGNTAYQGTWAGLTAYAKGDIVDYSGGLYSALEAHTSTASFDAALWDDLQTGYVYIEHAADRRVEGLYGLTSSGAPGILRTQSPIVFAAASVGLNVLIHRVRYADTSTTVYKRIALFHQHIETLAIFGRRQVARHLVQSDGSVLTYPANEALQEGVDYILNAATGVLTILSAWAPSFYARATYSWLLEQQSLTFTWRGAYATSTAYEVQDLVRYENNTYLVLSAHTSDGSVDAARYQLYPEPFAFGVSRPVREISIWLTDALRDEGTLYKNFGALLGVERPSSELYRAFLMAVSQLYWLGGTKRHLESALNATLELPLIRETGEVLQEYSNGIAETGTGARTYGYATGTDGVLDSVTSTFQSISSNFLTTDVGGTLRTTTATGVVRTFTIVNRTDANEVTVSPAPPHDEIDLLWTYEHPVRRNRIELTSTAYLFSTADIGGWFRLYSTVNEHNDRWFKILDVEGPLTIIVETPYGLYDEENLSWALSRTGEQRVVTSRETYIFALTTPLREDLKDSNNYRVLTFEALEPLSTVFTVEDHQDNPAWWYQTLIPEAISPGSTARRSISPRLYPHTARPLDGALIGDLGLRVGSDDQGIAPGRRELTALWYGGPTLVLSETLDASDLNQVLQITTPPYQGHYRLLSLGTDRLTATLDAFPPAGVPTPPRSLDVSLPGKVLRRSTAFTHFNTTLRRHSIHVIVRADPALRGDFLLEAQKLLLDTRAAETWVYVDTPTTHTDDLPFEDTLTVTVS